MLYLVYVKSYLLNLIKSNYFKVCMSVLYIVAFPTIQLENNSINFNHNALQQCTTIFSHLSKVMLRLCITVYQVESVFQ